MDTLRFDSVGSASLIRQFVHEPHAIEGRARPVAALLYRALLAQELFAYGLLDRLSRNGPDRDELVTEVTALIKTFERPLLLQRVVTSIRRICPGLKIVVVDDSRAPVPLEGVETVVMPFDSGISAGRNEGLGHVRTKYVLLLEDDLVFFRATRLAQALQMMERHPAIDIMGGQLIDLPFFGTRVPRAGKLFATSAIPKTPIGSTIGGLAVCERVSNFFIARTDRLKLVPWDPALRRLEHSDFFTRALGVLTTVFDPELKCLHARTPFDAEYMSKRLDLSTERSILARKHEAPR